MLEKILQSLEVSEEETRIYLDLLHSGPSTAGDLAKKLSIARATLYDTLQKMTDKGIVLRSLQNGIRTFRAEDPEKINHLIDKRIEEFQLHQHHLNKLIPSLSRGHQGFSPRFEFFEGLDSVQNAMQDFLFHYNIESLNYWHVDILELLSQEHFFYSNKKRIENNISQKLIVAGSKDFSIKKYPFLGEGTFFKRQMKLAPEFMISPMSYWIYGNKILFLSSKMEAYAHIIESYEMANMMREQFKAVWKISQTYSMRDGEADEFLNYLGQ